MILYCFVFFKLLKVTVLILLMSCLGGIFELQAQTVRYVREGATGEGRSWNNASGSLQAMIDVSQPGDAIYVAAGTYYAGEGRLVEDERGLGVVTRQRSFVMKAGVNVYGGFDVNPVIAEQETIGTRKKLGNARYGWQLANASVLSGRVLSGGTKDQWHWDERAKCWVPGGYIRDNAIHVVWFASNGFESLVTGEATPARPLLAESVLDGFTVEGGSADGIEKNDGVQGHSARFGGGVYLVGNGVLQNCVIRENYALTRGGGIFLNNGGRVSDCMVERNSSPGSSANRNGFGGGVYILSGGKIERSFMVNNSARIGGGLYCARDAGLFGNGIVVEMSIVANNTAMHEAGGVYCDKAGILTGVQVVKNSTTSLEIMGYGNTGGVYCNGYGVLTNCVLWENVASSAARQYYGNNVVAENVAQGVEASVHFVYCGVQKVSRENFENASVQQMTDLDADVQFRMVPAQSGVIDRKNYLSYADWDKEGCSVLYKKGATSLEAPVVGGTAVKIPGVAIDGVVENGRSDLGPYFIKELPVACGWLSNGKRIVYVDNQANRCGDGSSWDKPLRLISPAIQYLESYGGGEVWVKEGEYFPVVSDDSNDPRMFRLKMGDKVEVYGGFPRSLVNPGKEYRNPVLYRTIINGDAGVRGDNRDNMYNIVEFGRSLTKGAVLDGFTLLWVNSADNALPPAEGAGIRVLSENAIIRNCMIENCKAFDGAAIWSAVPVRIENCVINNNEVTNGFGAAVVKLAAGSELMNVTVVLNKGVGVALSSGRMTNSVAWGNTGDNYFDQVQVSGLPDVYYSAVQNQDYGKDNGNLVLPVENIGEGCVNFSNPTLAAGIIADGFGTVLGGRTEFEPNCISALVNKGTESDAPLLDIAGVSRARGGRMDIGAYQSTCMPGEDIRYVRAGGIGDGKSWETSSGDLQKMVNEVSELAKNYWWNNKKDKRPQVWVAAGTYYGGFEIKEGVDVYGGFPNYGTPGMDERQPVSASAIYKTVLDGQNKSRVLGQADFYNVLREVAWDGFTIQNGNISVNSGIDGGAGAKILKYGKLQNCLITGNTNRVQAASVIVRGAGVHSQGGVLVNCYITNNKAIGQNRYGTSYAGEVYGGGIYMTAGTVYNCVISGNSCQGDYADGCAVFVEQADFYNNTIVKNTGSGNVRVSAMRIGSFETAQFVITNCIIYDNAGTMLIDDRKGFRGASYSCIQGGYEGVGNISANPMFKGENDFRLQDNSPCINAGNTWSENVALPGTDMDYTARIKDCAVDMGAYESGRAEQVKTANIQGNRICFVTSAGAGEATGESWNNAACRTKLQTVIDEVARLGGGEVWVGTGDLGTEKIADFYPVKVADPLNGRTRSIIIPGNVRLLGGFRGVEKTEDERVSGTVTTVLNGDVNRTSGNVNDDVYHVAIVEKGGILEGFTVCNGNADGSGRSEYQRGGGIIVQEGGSVRNCYIEKCLSLSNGGGVYLAGKDASVTGSVVTANKAGGEGGGVYGEQYSNMTGNTVVRNEAGKGGGVSFHTPVRIMGCVVWGNNAGTGKNIWGDTESAYELNTGTTIQQVHPVSFSAVEGIMVSGRNNMRISARNSVGEISPEFVNPDGADCLNGGWDLSAASPLIDAGVSSDVVDVLLTKEDFYDILGLSSKDMAGRERVIQANTLLSGLRMDIGAYEADHIAVPKPGGKVCRLYVTRTARGTGDGSSWQNGMSDLQAALDYFRNNPCREGKGEIWVQGGYSYTPVRQAVGLDIAGQEHSFLLTENADVYGGFKGDATSGSGLVSEQFLDDRIRYDLNGNGIVEDFEFKYETLLDGTVGVGQHAYHVLSYMPDKKTEDVVLDGFSITGGDASGTTDKGAGGGVYATGYICLVNCIFRDNRASDNGGAVYAENGASILNSHIGGNTTGNNGGAVYLRGGVIANTNIFNNDGCGIYGQGARIVNTTVVRNGAEGVRLEDGNMVNSIVWGNTGRQVVAEGGAVVKYSGVQGGVDGVGNIALNEDNEGDSGPQFLKPTESSSLDGYDWTADWRVRSLSILLDAGKNEEYTPADLPKTVHRIMYYGNSGMTKIERIENERIDIGSYEYTLEPLNEKVCRMYVRTWENANVLSDGSSWDNATADLQGAIEAMERSPFCTNKEIWVAEGVYVPRKYGSTDSRSRSFSITSGGVKIYGGFPDDKTGLNPGMADRNPSRYKTILDATKTESYHVVKVTGMKEVVLDGLTIRGGRVSAENGEDYFGSGMFISGNKTRVLRCVFTGNDGGNGGVVYAHGDGVQIQNSLFHDNTGLAVYMNAGEITNTTIVNNDEGVGAHSGTVKNCVVWGNRVAQITHYGESILLVVNNGVQDGYPGASNIKLDAINDTVAGPRFIQPVAGITQDFELGCGSPLIDMGGSVMIDDNKDLAMKNRVNGKGIDIGAYESLRGAIPDKPEYSGPTTTCGGNDLILKIDNKIPGTEIYWMLTGQGVDFKWNAGQITVGDEVEPGEYVYRAARVDLTTECRSEDIPVVVRVAGVAVPQISGGGDSVCIGSSAVFTYTAENGELEVYDGDRLLALTEYSVKNNQVIVVARTSGLHTYRLRLKQNIPGFGNCKSRRSDSISVYVWDLPHLTSPSSAEINSGELFTYVPQSDLDGTAFSWKNLDMATSGTDTIREVLSNVTTINNVKVVTYLYTLEAKGCSSDYKLLVSVKPVTMDVTPQENCTASVTLDIRLGKGAPRLYRVTYDDNTTESYRSKNTTVSIPLTREIIVPQEIKVNAYSDVNGRNMIAETPNVWVWGGVTAPARVTSSSAVCYGDDVILTVTGGSSNNYRIYDNGHMLDSSDYTVNNNQVIIKMPAIGTHQYSVSVVMPRAGIEDCESSSVQTTVRVNNGSWEIIPVGNMTVKSGVQTNLTLTINGSPAFCEWAVKSMGADIQIAGGELKGSVINMTMLNTGTESELVVFAVRYRVDGGCDILSEVAVWVEPVDIPIRLQLESAPGKLCAGDAFEVIYSLSSDVQVIPTGLPIGVTMNKSGKKVTVSGEATVTFTYTLTPVGGASVSETVTVSSDPEFELGY